MALNISIGGTKGPVSGKKTRRRAPKSWIAQEAQSPETKAMFAKMKQESPVLQALLLSHLSGVPIKAEDIHLSSPKEQLEAALTVKVLANMEKNPELMAEAEEAVIGNLFSDSRRGGRYARRGGEEDPGFYPGMMPYGNDGGSIIDHINELEEVRERLGAKDGTMSKVLDSQMVTTLVSTLLPLLFNKHPAPVAALPAAPVIRQAPAGPRLIAVEIDGELIEMTQQAYEVFKRQRERLKQLTPPAATTEGAIVTTQTVVVATPPAPPPAGPPVATAAPGVTPPDPGSVAGAEVAQVPPTPITPQQKVLIVALGERIITALDTGMSAEEFVKVQVVDAESDSTIQFLLQILAGIDIEQVMALSCYKCEPDLEPLITKLENNVEWVKEALERIKALFPGETAVEGEE